jgi:Stage II sporulation protein E (SpoIIE)
MAADHDSILAELLELLDSAPAAAMADVTLVLLRRHLPVRAVWVYVADYGDEQLHLVPVSISPRPSSDAIKIRGSVPGRVYLTRTILQTNGEDGPVLWAPMFRRSESVGVLAIAMDTPDPAINRLIPSLAFVVGAAVLGARRHSDVFELARGAERLRLAAVMQWDLLPLPTYQEPRVEVAGRIEPAYDIGGDAFDFATNDGRVELGVFDAMGHGLRSTLLTTVALGAYRQARRRRSDLLEVAAEIDKVVHDHTDGEAFVTGHLCRLDLATGTLDWVNAGHPVPLLIRDHAASPLGSPEPMLPFGLEGTAQSVLELSLQPQDIVLFYSDGVTEARPKRGREFGLDRFMDMAGRHGDATIPLLVLVRQILDAVLDHTEASLQDDATLVALRWPGAAEPGPASSG